MAHESVESKRREYQPPMVRVLFVGESPPANGTFFYYLVDLCDDPVNDLAKPQCWRARNADIANLAAKMCELQPTAIVVVMKVIERCVARAAADAGLAETPRHVLPFPAQGHQRRYVAQLAELLRELDVT